METLESLLPGSATQRGFAAPLAYRPGFMQAPEPPCLKKAPDGSCQINLYAGALIAGVGILIGLAASAAPDEEFPELPLPDDRYINY